MIVEELYNDIISSLSIYIIIERVNQFMNLFENLNNYKEAIKKEATGVYKNADFEKAGYIYNKRDGFWYYPKTYTKGTNEYQLIYDDSHGKFIVYNKTKFDDPKTHDKYSDTKDNLATWDYKEVTLSQAIEKFKNLFNIKESAELRPFNKNDWSGWQGVNKFADGSEPYIAYGEYATLVIGGDSIPEEGSIVQIDYTDEDAEYPSFATKNFKDKEDAIRFGQNCLELIDSPIDENELRNLHFDYIE